MAGCPSAEPYRYAHDRPHWTIESVAVVAVVVALAVFMTNLDLWVINVALPAMGADFAHRGPVSLGDLSWVIDAYAITLAALLIVIGRIGDRVGQRPVFLAGVAVFTVASLDRRARVDAGLVERFRAAWVVGAALSIATAVVGVLLMRPVGAAPNPITV
jgi:MFS family permease